MGEHLLREVRPTHLRDGLLSHMIEVRRRTCGLLQRRVDRVTSWWSDKGMKHLLGNVNTFL